MDSLDVHWYVVAVEPPEYERTEVIGPFNSETDAKAYAMDLAADNGWENIEAQLLTAGKAAQLVTDEITYPYKEE